jgi:hypothetical protein
MTGELEAAGGAAAGCALPERRDRGWREIVASEPPARHPVTRLPRAIVCVASVGLVGAGLALAAAGGQKTLRFLEVSRPADARLVDHNGNRRRDPGDVYMSSSDLFRWADSKRGASMGRLQTVCILASRTTGNCTGTFSLTGGTIRTLGYVDFDDVVREVAVVGGSGVYAGAQGTFIAEQQGRPSAGRAVGTIRLLP